MSARRVLGFLIAAVLAGAVAAALVKSDEEPVAGPTLEPRQSASESPTASEPPAASETPTPTFSTTAVPTTAGETPSGQTTQTTEPTTTMEELPRTGDGSVGGVGALSILIALAAGFAVRRTAHSIE